MIWKVVNAIVSFPHPNKGKNRFFVEDEFEQL
jgi:hypothetical protein